MTLSGRAPYEYAKTKFGAHEVILFLVRIRPEMYPLKRSSIKLHYFGQVWIFIEKCCIISNLIEALFIKKTLVTSGGGGYGWTHRQHGEKQDLQA